MRAAALSKLLAATLVVCVAALSARAAQPADAEARYRAAAATFHRLRTSGDAAPARWREVAAAFRRIHDAQPDGPRGADALYSAALSHREAWKASRDWNDLSRATETFRAFVSQYPGDRLCDDSLMHLASLLREGYNDLPAAQEAYRRIVTQYAQGDQAPAARRHLALLSALVASAAPSGGKGQPGALAVQPVSFRAGGSGGQATGDGSKGRIRRVQVWSALEWTRVILSTTPGVRYRYEQLPAKGDVPERLYFDLQDTEPAASLVPTTTVRDPVLSQVRVSPHDGDTTRVVLELKGLDRAVVKDFSLPTEQKIVIDLYPPHATAASAAKHAAAKPAAATASTGKSSAPKAAGKAPASAAVSLRSSLGLKVRRIMLDPGHGGHDPGAIAYGVQEKDLVLDIARRLRDIIHRRHPDIAVGMTRDRDVFIPLQERPELAKAFRADLFVSIHLNANPIKRFHGVETYFLNLTSDGSALQVAARENATTEKRVSDLNNILFDLLRDTNIVESSKLARSLQGSLVGTLRHEEGNVRDLGVKQAPFLVLMGAEMPSVLVEAGFLTNRMENRRLRKENYLQQIALGIYEGLRKYIEEQNIAQQPRPPQPPAVSQNS